MAQHSEQAMMAHGVDAPSFQWLRQAPGAAALVLMAVIGVAIAAYLTAVHYAGVPLACTTNSVIDCAAVTTSSYSVVPGTQVPITVPGMLWFVVSGGLAAASWWLLVRRGVVDTRLYVAQAVWGAIGLATVLYLVYAETQLHKICEWCTSVHVLTLLSFLVALYRLQQLPDLAAAREDDETDG